jgi:hypothetical protein
MSCGQADLVWRALHTLSVFSEPSGPDLAAVRSLGRPGFARIPQVTDMAVAPKGGAGWLIPTGLAMAG